MCLRSRCVVDKTYGNPARPVSAQRMRGMHTCIIVTYITFSRALTHFFFLIIKLITTCVIDELVLYTFVYGVAIFSNPIGCYYSSKVTARSFAIIAPHRTLTRRQDV